ncbi:discoidin domain-containing protein [Streptomyces sp. NRRL S-241]|uniref:discoidin domain-containing protein n=1 Tax=Streptomyces sp. NRRL S-241 TaxID=1463896 RepID=UPI0004BEA15C|nr:discoidin domain-containing protein [Streptomyces sp. NRRL S-241]
MTSKAISLTGKAICILSIAATTLALPTAAPAHAAPPANTAPPVLPAIQQWTGGSGRVVLGDQSRIVTPAGSTPQLQQLAGKVVSDTAELTGLHLTAATGTAAAGDVLLKIDPAADFGAVLPALKPEAYRIDVSGGKATVTAAGQQGAINGATTLLQIVVGSADHRSLPVGSAVDFPNYAVRGFMLDVGRRYFTPEFIRSYIKWMGYQKLNTLQIHLNDNEITPPNGDWSQAKSAFRLQSDNPAFAGLAATDGVYTRADWDSFEDAAAAAGVTLVPEIDAPGHARAFTKFKPELGLNGGNSDHLDLSKPASTDFMKSVYAEFTPWFRGPNVHIGADEYDKAYVGQYKTYINTIAPYVRSLGKQVSIWGSFSTMSGGGAGYDPDLTVNSWNNGWYGPKKAIADGYDVINSNDNQLYVVPFANYYHGQGLDGQWIFNSWEPHVFPGDQTLAKQDPHLLGAMPAVWNDLVRANYTELQVHGLVEKSFPALAQKMWSGTKAGTDYQAFLNTTRAVGQGPGTAHLPDTLGSNDVTSDLARGRSTTASSTDAAPLQASNATDGLPDTRWSSKYTDDQWLQVDLGSVRRISTATLTWEAAYAKDYDLRVSTDGTTWTTVSQRRGLTGPTADQITFPATDARYVRMQGIKRGTAYGYSLYGIDVRGAADLAAGKPATASSSETPWLTPELAFDNNGATRWSSERTDNQWLQVDLGSAQTVSGASLTWEVAYAKDYDLQVSTDGTTWTTVSQQRGHTAAGTDNLTFTPTDARYVRMQGIKRGTGYGYSLYSLRLS